MTKIQILEAIKDSLWNLNNTFAEENSKTGLFLCNELNRLYHEDKIDKKTRNSFRTWLHSERPTKFRHTEFYNHHSYITDYRPHLIKAAWWDTIGVTDVETQSILNQKRFYLSKLIKELKQQKIKDALR